MKNERDVGRLLDIANTTVANLVALDSGRPFGDGSMLT